MKKIKQSIIGNKETNSTSIYCYGKEFPFDHPKIYLEIDSKRGYVVCPYCSKCFELKSCRVSS